MKNEFEIRGDVTAIFVKAKGGKMLETLIDTSDLPIADSMPNSWYAHADSSQHRYYVEGQRSINKSAFGIHLRG
ncbi:hypothetical protein GCM10025857_68140 [Alicyclobacillus contaminans]|nr:hypothetical protein GCM10025857_68140 [Alicyclobacillus contaminans]